MQNQRNIILALVLSALVLFGWDAALRYFYPHADSPQKREAVAAKEESASAVSHRPTREGGLTDPADIALEKRELSQVLNEGGRVPVKAPGLSGSINLQGALVDDLVTNRHKETIEKNSGPARIFSPAGTPAQHFAQFGWVGEGIEFPGPDTVWSAPPGAVLSPQNPVTLRWTNQTGQTFTIRYEIDSDYMIRVTQTLVNSGEGPIVARPFALVRRTDKTASVDIWNLHSGPIGAFDGTVQFGPDYDELAEARIVETVGRTDWIGFTDIYWMSALIPGKGGAQGTFRSLGSGLYRADLLYQPVTVGKGRQITHSTQLFAGAKESAVLDRYEQAGIANFGLAIDWGWFAIIEKPLLWLLIKLFTLTGNFGVAIMLLTVIVRAIMFPIAQRQFASMAQMRAIQPKMKAIQERYKDDRQKQQQEIMALYKKEGVNPLAGCLPIFLQIPIFFALYKVLTLAVEMRHQPFILWIRDLSVPEPLHILNLFGLLPFTPPSFLGVGVLALLLGVTMWLQFKLNPAQMDPVQQQIFMIMPWFMMFVMAPFAAGLLLYWITSNVLTIAQQWYLYSKHPQLKAQAEKEALDRQRAAERDAAAKGKA
ncbi:MAG: membrane protein insertase YidC [Novosphingobium sp.]|nr:membrane protein insertase YidC [Novosphingobium sp.]